MSPIFPWMGGKRRLAPFLLPLFPDHRCYVEPFAGAAALYFMKPESEVEVINDINSEVVNLYRVLKHHLEEFLRQFKWALTSREMYRWEQMAVPATLTDIQRAARWFYLQKLAFGAKVEGQTFGTETTSRPRLNLLRLEEDLSAAWMRLANTWIENLPWHEVVQRYDRPHTLVYCDPPYWETAGYGVDFPLSEYDRMAEMARTMQGTMIISVNDHPEMRRAFAGLPMRTVEIDYTVGGGAGSAAQELVIGNWRGGWPEARPLTRQIDMDWA